MVNKNGGSASLTAETGCGPAEGGVPGPGMGSGFGMGGSDERTGEEREMNGSQQTATAEARVVEEGPEAQALVVQAKTWNEQAGALVVRTGEDYEIAAMYLRDLKTVRDRVKTFFDPIVSAAPRAHQKATEARRTVADPLAAAEKVIKRKMGDYIDEQERVRRETQRKAEEALRRQEEDRRLREAEKLQAEGRIEKAMAALDEPILVPEVVIERETPKAAGVGAREAWKGEIVNLAAFLGWVIESPVDRLQYVTVNAGAVNRLAGAVREAEKIPGLKTIRENVISARKA